MNMVDDLKQLLEEASSPGDMAAILLAGSIGFVIDAGINAVGFLSPGAVGLLSASTALGMKKGWEAWREAHREQRKTERAAAECEARALRLLRYLEGKDEPLRAALLEELELLREGISTIANLDMAVESSLTKLRTRRLQ